MKLLTPIRIGNLEVKNRIVMPPMHTGFGSEEGRVTERMISYYEERAKGGVGLIIVEFTAVERRGKAMSLQLMIDNDRLIPGLRRLAEAIKNHGAKAAIQLQHAGVKASAKITQIQPIGPSIFSAYPAGMGPAPRALTVEEIHDLVLAFGESARIAKEAGFDAIELHCTHSYLIDQFMSPRFNKRTDHYGGSIENRARFACEILECMKEKVGKDYPIICRITGDDYVEGGITLEDAKANAKRLVKSGADGLHVSVGISDNMVSTPPMSFPQGCFVHLAQGVKEVVDVPVITVGRINDPIFAEQVLTENRADLVAMGRALIADPALPRKVEKGQFDDIVPCIYCNQGCISRVFDGLGITCLGNPAAGKETEMQIVPAKISKRVLVAGAGPAGLEAAITCQKRGHEVILVEKEKRLGGQLNYAFKPPKKDEIEKLLRYFSKQVEKLRIKTYLGRYVNKELIQEIKPQIIILATGATPIIPPIPGIKGKNVLLATEILEGKKPLGKTAIIIGGGQTGLETGDFLAEQGLEVTILEMLSDAGRDMPLRNRMFLMKEMLEKKIRILVNREVKEITEEGVLVEHLGQREEFKGDTIVLAAGSRPERNMLQEWQDIIPQLEGIYLGGDCVEPRNALEAIHETAQIARQI